MRAGTSLLLIDFAAASLRTFIGWLIAKGGRPPTIFATYSWVYSFPNSKPGLWSLISRIYHSQKYETKIIEFKLIKQIYKETDCHFHKKLVTDFRPEFLINDICIKGIV